MFNLHRPTEEDVLERTEGARGVSVLERGDLGTAAAAAAGNPGAGGAAARAARSARSASNEGLCRMRRLKGMCT